MARARLAVGIVAVFYFFGFFVPAAKAQQQAPQSTATPAPHAQSQPQAPPPTADGMGVSLKSIRRQASVPPGTERQSWAGMRYDFFVDVFGKRPAIDFFKDFDLSKGGAVRYGSVTHQELLDAATPYPFHIYQGGINVLPTGKKK
jgi:hypothetical protein